MSSHSSTCSSFQPEAAVNAPAGSNDIDAQKGHEGDAPHAPALPRDIRQPDPVDPHGSALDDEEEEDDFDLNDPYFRSRSASAGVLTALPGFSASSEEGGQVKAGVQAEQVPDSAVQVIAPKPKHHFSLTRGVAPDQPFGAYSMDRSPNRSGGGGGGDSASGSPSGTRPQNIKGASASPSLRGHGLSALSPLQTFSPLRTAKDLQDVAGLNSAAASDGTRTPGSESGRSRASSITRSLSRRESLYRGAEIWNKDEDEYHAHNQQSPTEMFSRLTLVKAPVKKEGIRQRSKSSSALAPMNSFSSGFSFTPTADRTPRRSFAISSFGDDGTSRPRQSLAPVGSYPGELDTLHRISRPPFHQGMHTEGSKSLTPLEVVELARGLCSPVLATEDGDRRSELQRRKSTGMGSYRRKSSSTQVEDSPEPKSPLALEPVEYVQMDDDTLLPFVDRPAEVKELMEHRLNQNLFRSLGQMFPKDAARKNWQEIPPEEWNWAEVVLHMTAIDRIECPDYNWVRLLRMAVRKRSVALWEKLGACLGCDGDLLLAGGEDGKPNSWAGLSLAEGGDYDLPQDQVYIEGLEPVDPEELRRAERQFREEFGDIVEDDAQASGGMNALLGTIGESEEDAHSSHGQVGRSSGAGSGSSGEHRKSRTKSFVGLTISTSPQAPPPPFLSMSLDDGAGVGGSGGGTHFAHGHSLVSPRAPGSPLFPSSFSTLSMEPSLGRKASHAVGGIKPMTTTHAADLAGMRKSWGEMRRRQSGTGLSESAITFASDSEYNPSAPQTAAEQQE